jgi:hypothetical protein
LTNSIDTYNEIGTELHKTPQYELDWMIREEKGRKRLEKETSAPGLTATIAHLCRDTHTIATVTNAKKKQLQHAIALSKMRTM